jgi:proline iminopeptidase
LESLADQRRIVLYDQLGCGRSDKPNNPSLWQIERFCDEIDSLRERLSLKNVILYGHSWGGWLAQEYLARRGRSASVEALILASTSASARQFAAGARRLLRAMPGVADRLAKLEAEGKMQSLEYNRLVNRFYDAHLINMRYPPAFAGKSGRNLATSRTYPVMNGPNEFTVTGNLRNWDRTASLRQIHIPTLVLTSSLDEFTVDCAETLHHGIAASKLVVLQGSRHLAMIEQPHAYVAVLRRFLSRLA